MPTPENPSAQGVTRDPQRHTCHVCGRPTTHTKRAFTPPSERAYFHPTRFLRWYCHQCAPAHLADGRCHATIDTTEPCSNPVRIGSTTCPAHERRIKAAMRVSCARYGIPLDDSGAPVVG